MIINVLLSTVATDAPRDVSTQTSASTVSTREESVGTRANERSSMKVPLGDRSMARLRGAVLIGQCSSHPTTLSILISYSSIRLQVANRNCKQHTWRDPCCSLQANRSSSTGPIAQFSFPSRCYFPIHGNTRRIEAMDKTRNGRPG